MATEPTVPRATTIPSPSAVTGDPRKGLIDNPSNQLLKNAPALKLGSFENLKARIMRPAMTSHYWVEIPDVGGLYQNAIKKREAYFNGSGISVRDLSETLSLSCCDAVLPGATFYTHEIQNDRTGVTEKIPYRRVYDDQVSFSFYVNVNYTSLVFFEAWMQLISGEGVEGIKNTNYFYRMPYPDNNSYRTDINITKFEKNYGQKEYNKADSPVNDKFAATGGLKYTFLQAYPISIDSMPLSYEGSSLLKVTVGFSFTRYYLN